ncbi:unnamed protein product [Allacma fusca]|uniref:Uncharacterized protein n=1 Tax=Allacma fusca TaxID=39272 RepID=A0A8J2L7E6_9HEXA|nr:unnamed protein product [Allacma fusca]
MKAPNKNHHSLLLVPPAVWILAVLGLDTLVPGILSPILTHQKEVFSPTVLIAVKTEVALQRGVHPVTVPIHNCKLMQCRKFFNSN